MVGRPVRGALLIAALSMLAGPVWAADDCSSAGTRAFRTEGVDAAYAAFDADRQRDDCRRDPQLAFNYARAIQSILDRDGDDERACAAAQAYGQAATAAVLPGAVRAMSARGRADMDTRCKTVKAGAPSQEDYQTLVDRARAKVRAGDKAGAAEAWKAASESKPDAALPHRALCSLLRDLDRHDEGRGHCRAWRSLEPAVDAAPAGGMGTGRTITWVITGASAAALVGGVIFYADAMGAADDAFGARRDALAAGSGPGYDLGRDAMNASIERAKTNQTAAFIMLGAGAALGGWALFRVLNEDEGATAAVGVGVGSFVVRGRF